MEKRVAAISELLHGINKYLNIVIQVWAFCCWLNFYFILIYEIQQFKVIAAQVISKINFESSLQRTSNVQTYCSGVELAINDAAYELVRRQFLVLNANTHLSLKGKYLGKYSAIW
jgi:hypothetical protein